MGLTFQRPKGAAIDIKELEYISALHQTSSSELRKDASIQDVDIMHFLCSRYGIRIGAKEIRDKLLTGFAAGEEAKEVLDLAEVMALILIPFLIKAELSSSECVEQTEEEMQPEQPKEKDPSEYIELGHIDYLRKLQIAKKWNPSQNIIQKVLDMILEDVTGSSSPKVLDRSLIKAILTAYGENELAANENLIESMVLAASSGHNGDDEIYLNHEVFARALTSDVQKYNILNEVEPATFYSDVFADDSTTTSGRRNSANSVSDAEEASNHSHDNSKPSYWTIFTAPAIDFVSNSYRSKFMVILLWSGFILFYFAYTYMSDRFYGKNQEEEDDVFLCQQDDFGCMVGKAVGDWFRKLSSLIVSGFLFIGLGSLGNGAEPVSICGIICALVAIAFLTLANFFTAYLGVPPNDKGLPMYIKESAILSLILGCALIVMQLLLLVLRCTNKEEGFQKRYGSWIFARGYAERNKKQAAAYKVQSMVQNALSIHEPQQTKQTDKIESFFGKALLNFFKLGNSKQLEPTGGFIWTWKRIFNQELFTQEGISLSARILAGNFSMVLICLIVIMFGIEMTQWIAQDYGKSHEVFLAETMLSFLNLDNVTLYDDIASRTAHELNDTIKTMTPSFILGKYNITCPSPDLSAQCVITNDFSLCGDVNTVLLCALQNVTIDFSMDSQVVGGDLFEFVRMVAAQASVIALQSIYPEEKYMVVRPMIIATSFAFIMSIFLLAIYIPSAVTLTLKLRTGVIPTLDDRYFPIYRQAVDHVTMILGSMFWGTLASSALVGAFIGFVVFLFLWQITRPYALGLLAHSIGWLITLILKILLLQIFRSALYAAFYRKIPASANLLGLALECWNVALSIGLVFFRGLRLILITMTYIGRIDTPFLAPGVGVIGGLVLDNHPNIFRKEVLSIEAHRHPYLETLGVMYLMKIKYGKNFATTSGSCWRLLFVFALMPWLRKYRIMTRPDMFSDSEEEFNGDQIKCISTRLSSARNIYDGLEEETLVADHDICSGNHTELSSPVMLQTYHEHQNEKQSDECQDKVEIAMLKQKISTLEEIIETLKRRGVVEEVIH